MIIKKYQAGSEKEAITLAKEDLGKEAIVMNIKTIKPKGLFKIFSKTTVEITAAIDENFSPAKKGSEVDFTVKDSTSIQGNMEEKNSAIEEKLNSLTEMLEKQMVTAKEESMKKSMETEVSIHDLPNPQKDSDKLVELVFEQLVNNEVSLEYARALMDELDFRCKDGALDDLLASVYQKIILKLGQTKTIELEKDKTKVVCFIGPTGVGKTTTIAKIASKFKLEEKIKVAIITADTYRIAAVEQIKTYASILAIPVSVVYEAKDFNEAIEKYKEYDLVLIDTAGRSHKNTEQFNDAKALLEAITDYKKEVYLVVSATTKYNDLSKITSSYSKITDYSLIFTKLDETMSYGNILNVKLDTKAPLAYVTFGQGVPEDISVLNPQDIAKQLLGGSE